MTAVHPIQPIIICVPPQPTRYYEKFSNRIATGLAITQVVIGLLCIGIGIGATFIDMLYSYLSFFGHGIWCGTFFVICGAVGISAGKTRQLCQIVGFMVLSIISIALFVPALNATSTLGIVLFCSDCYSNFQWNEILSESILLVLACSEFIVGIASAIVCCRGVCCGRSNDENMWPNGEISQITVAQQVISNSPQVLYIKPPTAANTKPAMFIHPGRQQQPVARYGQPPRYSGLQA